MNLRPTIDNAVIAVSDAIGRVRLYRRLAETERLTPHMRRTLGLSERA